MKPPSSELLPQYAAALQEYLAGGGEGVLRRAYELGRQTLADGFGVLEMGVLLHRTLLTAGPGGRTPAERAQRAALECLSPFEMAHRGVREANSALRRHNEMLEEVAKRIAHSLHDEAAQLLGCVYVALDDVDHRGGLDGGPGGDLDRDSPLPNRSGSAQQRDQTRTRDERERSTAAGGATDPLFDPR